MKIPKAQPDGDGEEPIMIAEAASRPGTRKRQDTEATRSKATTCDKGMMIGPSYARRLPRTATCEFGFLLRGFFASNGNE